MQAGCIILKGDAIAVEEKEHEQQMLKSIGFQSRITTVKRKTRKKKRQSKH
jgi:hypothetical protein